MRYFDTSFLVPLALPEATSERLSGFLQALQGTDLAVSHWTRVESASLLAREARMGGPDVGTAREAGSQFETMIAESLAVLLPNRDDFDRAEEWLGNFETGLRAGDTPHLAIAGSRGADAIYSLDKPMFAAGKTLGLPASAATLPGHGDWRTWSE